MRLLTPPEIREIEAILRTIRTTDTCIEIADSNRDMWLNVLSVVLETNEAMLKDWRKLDSKLTSTGL